MKKSFYILALVTLTLTSCKKDKPGTPTPYYSYACECSTTFSRVDECGETTIDTNYISSQDRGDAETLCKAQSSKTASSFTVLTKDCILK